MLGCYHHTEKDNIYPFFLLQITIIFGTKGFFSKKRVVVQIFLRTLAAVFPQKANGRKTRCTEDTSFIICSIFSDELRPQKRFNEQNLYIVEAAHSVDFTIDV